MLRHVPLPPSANSLEEHVFLEPCLYPEVSADFVRLNHIRHLAAVLDNSDGFRDVS